MPYIDRSKRIAIANADVLPSTAGELNFRLTEVIKEYFVVKGLSYQTINDIVGALEGCKLELYRRVAGKYEDKKIQENGDVFPSHLI